MINEPLRHNVAYFYYIYYSISVMSTQGTIKRYTLLIEKISKGQNPSFIELKDFLDDHGFNISQRTLQRDIEQIRNEFGIEIKYNRSVNGYVIDVENSTNLDSFIKFLEMVGTSEILADGLRDGKASLDFISFEGEGNLKGIENLRSIVLAIKNNRKIKFTHENYTKGTIKEHIICPYHLKEYQNRWYVFGNFEDTGTFRTFAIDRITNLKVLAEKFKPNQKINPVKSFDEVVGLNYTGSKIEEVQIWVTPQQIKYLESLPLHKSQETIHKDKDGAIIRLYVRINYELIQKILTLCNNAKVLEPKVLRDEVKEYLEEMVSFYKK